MQTYSYYPGCTLKNKAKILDEYARKCASILGFSLEEIDNWQCCGGVYPMAKDKIVTRLSSVRTLAQANEKGRTLVTLCSACHNVIKQVNRDMQTDEYIISRVNNYLGTEASYHGETKVLHYLEVLRDVVGFDNIKNKVVNPLTGVKIGAYYGCLLLRPSKVMQMDSPENPKILEDFIKAIGGEPIIYAERNECCGAYLAMEDGNVSKMRSNKILDNADKRGAEMLITACPLCMYNLNKSNLERDAKVPVVYFTELLAQALGVKGE